MKKLNEELINNRKGITLISLVITIIVLLILAGVSIATLTGDNGILQQATRSKEETEKASIEEQKQLAMIEASMSFEEKYYTDNSSKLPLERRSKNTRWLCYIAN